MALEAADGLGRKTARFKGVKGDEKRRADTYVEARSEAGVVRVDESIKLRGGGDYFNSDHIFTQVCLLLLVYFN